MKNLAEFLIKLPLILATWATVGLAVVLELTFGIGIIAKLMGVEISSSYWILFSGLMLSGLLIVAVYWVAFKGCHKL